MATIARNGALGELQRVRPGWLEDLPLSVEPAADSSVVALRRSVRRWRAIAIAASIFAALLAIWWVARETSRETLPREYLAILQKDAASPAFEVMVNLDRRELTVRPVAAREPANSHKYWITDAKLDAPRPLGVIAETARATNLAAAVVESATYAAGRDLIDLDRVGEDRNEARPRTRSLRRACHSVRRCVGNL
jgi:anti-sigma-K factor RskA